MLPNPRSLTPQAASHTRLVLNCDFTTSPPEVVERIGFVDDDAVTARSSGGIVGRSVVDDLHSEVEVDVVEADGAID